MFQFAPVYLTVNPAGNYMFKVNNRTTRARCEIYSKLTIKTPERRCSSVFIVNLEQVNAEWKAISCQWSLSIPPENIRKKEVNIVFNTVFSTVTTG